MGKLFVTALKKKNYSKGKKGEYCPSALPIYK